ncbi:MAG: hypothetical protein E7338_00545 [Clostridiales bacterium]|nr:hypothetical protein [Clostridiales bacterium]
MEKTSKRKQNQDLKAIKKELAMLLSEQKEANNALLPSETVQSEPEVQDTPIVQNTDVGAASVAIDNQQDQVSLHKPVKGYTKKELRKVRLKNRLIKPNDIKYRGIFSYRYLRAFAWISIAISQIVLLHSASEAAYSWLYWGTGSQLVLREFADMSMPLFLVATFAYILNRQKTHANMLIFYFASYFGIAILEVFMFRRYAISIMSAMGVESKITAELLGALAGQKVQVNVFSDLAVLTAFNFFINYTPKKHFQGKYLKWFRVMCIIPILISITSYVVRWLGVNEEITLPIDVYPFLTTKSPYVHIIFIIISLWIKYREQLFLKFGATSDEYEKFLKTRRNSLSFSIQVSKLFALFSLIDFLTLFTFLVVGGIQGYESELVLAYAQSIGIGQCTGLFFTIPIVLLFSYTKSHKYQSIDIILPMVGVALFVLVYIEGAYEIALNLIKTAETAIASAGV